MNTPLLDALRYFRDATPWCNVNFPVLNSYVIGTVCYVKSGYPIVTMTNTAYAIQYQVYSEDDRSTLTPPPKKYASVREFILLLDRIFPAPTLSPPEGHINICERHNRNTNMVLAVLKKISPARIWRFSPAMTQ